MATAGVQLVTFLVLMVLSQPLAAFRSCPVVCKCSEHPNTGLLKATCTQDDLWYVPSFSNVTTSVIITTKSLASLEDFAFDNARRLTYIKLMTPSLEYISAHAAFDYLRELQTLYIRSRNTVTIEPGVFNNLRLLSNVIFEGNLTKLPTRYLCDNLNLTRLYLRNNWITYIDFPQCVDKLQDLRYLDISGNPLKSVDKSNFYYLRTVKLTNLLMSNCDLRELPSDLFHYTPYLKTLNLNDNKIRFLEPNMFWNLTYLDSLLIAGLLTHTIPLRGDEPTMSLMQLNLSNCKYMNISFGVQFRKATRLSILLLDNTPLDSLDQNTFVNLATSKTRILSLKNSKINKVSADALTPLVHLENLNMANSPSIAEAVHNVTVGASNSLSTLGLMHTGLSSLDHNVFSGFSGNNSLTDLELRKNSMTMIKNNTFVTLSKLICLDLSGNSLQLDSLKESAFAGLMSLQRLVLSGNKFEGIPNPSIVGELLSLQILEMNGNLIKTIGSFEGYDALTSLNLRNNRIKVIKRECLTLSVDLIPYNYNRMQYFKLKI